MEPANETAKDVTISKSPMAESEAELKTGEKAITANKATKAGKTTAANKATKEKKATVAKKAPAKKASVKEESARKAVAEKTPIKKKRTRRTKKTEIFVQFEGHQVSQEELVEKVKVAWAQSGNKVSEIITLSLYVKPEDFKAYYVINGNSAGEIDL